MKLYASVFFIPTVAFVIFRELSRLEIRTKHRTNNITNNLWPLNATPKLKVSNTFNLQLGRLASHHWVTFGASLKRSIISCFCMSSSFCWNVHQKSNFGKHVFHHLHFPHFHSINFFRDFPFDITLEFLRRHNIQTKIFNMEFWISLFAQIHYIRHDFGWIWYSCRAL